MTEKTFWTKLEEIGWLDYVPMAEHADLRKRIKKSLAGKEPELTPYCQTQASFDAECINDDGDYTRVISDLAESSGNKFAPKNITDKLDSKKETGRVSFLHKSKRYSCSIPFEHDYFDDKVLKLVNRALADSKVKERFINLPSIDQCYYLVFVPPSVYEKAVKAKSIPEQDFFMKKEFGEDWLD